MICNTYQKNISSGPLLPYLSERTKNLLIFRNTGSRNNLTYCLFGCVAISGLYLFHEIVLSSPCFIFPKNVMLWFIDNVTTETFSIIYLKCCASCLYCCHVRNRWISIRITRHCKCYWCFRYYTFFWPWQIKFSLQLINGKSRDLQILLKYFNV